MAAPFSLSPRPLDSTTVLAGKEVILIPPREESESGLVEALVARMIELGARPRVLKFTEKHTLRDLKGPAIVWGNLANSDAVRELYFQFLVMTDLRYPGAGGYELRTLTDPYGAGTNILYFGYSDETGCQAGLARLLRQLAPTAPRLFEIQANGLPITDFQVEMIRESPFPPLDWMITADPIITHKGYLAYLTGDADLLEQAHEVWRRIVAYGVPAGDHNIKDLHLRTSMLAIVFRLQETAGMVPEELRGPILNYLLDWVYSDQGITRMDVPENTAPGVQRQNHGTIPALALAYLSSYLRDFYPERSEPGEWDELVNRIFAPYADGSWKPASEGICHGWWLEQPVLLEYGLLDRQKRFLTGEGARRAADCAIAVTNNFGWLSSSGDVNLTRSFAGVSLRTAAAWYRDPRYTFVHQLAPDFHALRMHQFLSRTFDIGLGAEEPETGLTLIPLDSIVHHGATHHRDIASWMFENGPTAPVERCFDKINFRSGWTPDDAFLLIDGIGGGSHAYADALDLVEYSRLGYSFLVSETGPKFPETEHHAVVTVARNGVSDSIPCFGEWEEATWEAPTQTGYARVALRGNNGATWTRELFFLNEHGLVIHDHVCAEVDGDFTLQSNLRTPGKISWESGRSVARRQQDDGSEVLFTLQPIGPSAADPHVVERDHSVHIRHRQDVSIPRPEDDNVAAWERRYGITDVVVSITRMRVHARLKVGEGVSFVHLAHARHAEDPEPELVVTDSGGIEIRGFDETIALTPHRPIELEPESWVSSGEEIAPGFTVSGLAKDLPDAPKQIVPLADGGVVIALESGEVWLVGPDGTVQWKCSLRGPIYDMDVGPELVFVGHDQTSLTALRVADGAIAWDHQVERIPSSCAWWEWSTAAAFEVVAAQAETGFDGVIVGCGDIQMRRFDAAGNCLWNFRYVNGIPGTIRLLDVNGDGVDEIIVGGEVMSNCSHCRVVDAAGNQLQEVEVEGWTSRMTALSMTRGSPNLIAFGATRGRNLHFLESDPNGAEPLQRRWMRRMPGVVTAIHIDADQGLVLAGNSQGLLVAFDFAGEVMGRLALTAEVQSIWPTGEGYLAGLADGAGEYVLRNESGGLAALARWNADARWDRVVRAADKLLIPIQGSLVQLSL